MFSSLLRCFPKLLLGVCLLSQLPPNALATSTVLTNNPPANAKLASAGGTLTDIIFALGAGDQLLAVDTSSTSPAAAANKASIGYYRSLSAESLIATGATELWALEGTGPAATLSQLRNTGIKVEHFAKPRDLAELYEFISLLGAKLQKEAAATALINQIKQSLPVLPTTAANTKPLTALFVLQASSRGVIVAGSETVPDLLFHYSAMQNLATHNGFKPISAEFLMLQQPDLLVVPEHVAQSAGGLNAFCQLPELRMLAAAKDCRVLVMDSLLSMGMTSRIGEAIQQLYQFGQQTALTPAPSQATLAQPSATSAHLENMVRVNSGNVAAIQSTTTSVLGQ
ncbi:heme/hemin ABC transporter substrate-binding protein [Alishewanella sp. d11]|uniref:heme/hemin ABC transporter substrate-binding protein n=1 Tax=Alishewanella sp. d11 TaxID=3414030 RepID=UPI003BF7DD51